MTDSSNEIVIIGIGEIGGVLAKGFLRLGYTVHPLTRKMRIEDKAEQILDPALVIVAVGEADLPAILETMPNIWQQRLCLLQNELLPDDWREIENPTVLSIWFEKKPGMDPKVIIPSPVFGPQASLICDALNQVNIPTRTVMDEDQLLFQLVTKNLYILTTNLAGLQTGGTVDELWNEHRAFAESVAREVIQLQQVLTGKTFDAEALLQAMQQAFDGDPQHKCMGRSAPARLRRALTQARQHGLTLPQLLNLEQTLAA
jgi:ketopantoate reductase